MSAISVSKPQTPPTIIPRYDVKLKISRAVCKITTNIVDVVFTIFKVPDALSGLLELDRSANFPVPRFYDTRPCLT